MRRQLRRTYIATTSSKIASPFLSSQFLITEALETKQFRVNEKLKYCQRPFDSGRSELISRFPNLPVFWFRSFPLSRSEGTGGLVNYFTWRLGISWNKTGRWSILLRKLFVTDISTIKPSKASAGWLDPLQKKDGRGRYVNNYWDMCMKEIEVRVRSMFLKPTNND